jgi:hypothetical protein
MVAAGHIYLGRIEIMMLMLNLTFCEYHLSRVGWALPTNRERYSTILDEQSPPYVKEVLKYWG